MSSFLTSTSRTMSTPVYTSSSIRGLTSEAEAALSVCQSLMGRVEGATKLRKRIAAELKFLRSLGEEDDLDVTQVQSSNMRHLLGILHIATTYPDVTHILKTIKSQSSRDAKFEEDMEDISVTVDVICNKGCSWVKAVARNDQALHLVWAGGGHYGVDTLFAQAEDFRILADENLSDFRPPGIVFVFFSGVTQPMAEALQKMGISVVGHREKVSEETKSRLAMLDDDDEFEDGDCEGVEVDDSDDDMITSSKDQASRTPLTDSVVNPATSISHAKSKHSSSLGFSVSVLDPSFGGLQSPANSDLPSSGALSPAHDSDPFAVPRFLRDSIVSRRKVFLDISTMIAMTSALCNGHAHYVFPDKILSEQAIQERQSPLLPEIEPLMEGKELYTCEAAVNDFKSILSLLGGVEERVRGESLLARLHIVPDAPSARASALVPSASIKPRAKLIFGSADALEAVILTANRGFVRAAAGQGVNIAAHLHQSRALTEGKQADAKPFTSPS